MTTKLRSDQLDTGIGPNKVVTLDAGGALPPVDGSQLTGVGIALTPWTENIDTAGHSLVTTAASADFSITPPINIISGDNTGIGGTVTITSGSGTDTRTNGYAGDINIIGGSSTGGIGSSGGVINLTAGVGYNGGDINLTAGDTTANSNGGRVSLAGGVSKFGGDITLTPGVTNNAGGGGTDGVVLLGGNLDTAGFNLVTSNVSTANPANTITIQGGDNSYVGGDQYSGNVFVNAGNATNGNYAGYISLYAGAADTRHGGYVNIVAGNSATSYAGSVNLRAGDSTVGGDRGATLDLYGGYPGSTLSGDIRLTGGAGNSQEGGSIGIVSGSAVNGSSQPGGKVYIRAGAGDSSGTGGDMDITAGRGGTSLPGGLGGAVNIISGEGRNFAAGDVNITGGVTQTTGNAGSVTITGGQGNTNNAGTITLQGGTTQDGQGGDVVISAGTAGALGTPGSIILTPGLSDISVTKNKGYVNIHTQAGLPGPGSIRLFNDTDAAHTTGFFTELQVGNNVANLTLVLPIVDGAAGDVLQTDSSGILSFVPKSDLGEFLFANLPAAAAHANSYALVTDLLTPVVGRGIVRSDGTNWMFLVAEGAIAT